MIPFLKETILLKTIMKKESVTREVTLSPWKPQDYVNFLYFYFTFQDSDVSKLKRYSFYMFWRFCSHAFFSSALIGKYGKMIPVFMAGFLWISVLLYTMFVDIFIIPSSLRQEVRDPVFPWTLDIPGNDTSTETLGSPFIDMMLVRKGNPAFNPGGTSNVFQSSSSILNFEQYSVYIPCRPLGHWILGILVRV